MMCTCECCTGIICTNSGISGGDAETRDNSRFPVYLALILGYREETLKPGIIPGNPVYLEGMYTYLARCKATYAHLQK